MFSYWRCNWSDDFLGWKGIIGCIIWNRCGCSNVKICGFRGDLLNGGGPIAWCRIYGFWYVRGHLGRVKVIRCTSGPFWIGFPLHFSVFSSNCSPGRCLLLWRLSKVWWSKYCYAHKISTDYLFCSRNIYILWQFSKELYPKESHNIPSWILRILT